MAPGEQPDDADVAAVAELCRSELDLSSVAPPAWRYSALPLCVLDAIFSINASYTSAANVVQRYADHVGLDPRWTDEEHPAVEDQHTVGDMLALIESVGRESFREDVLDNNQWTAPRGGGRIRKAEAAEHFAQALAETGIQTLQNVQALNDDHPVRERVLNISGQGSGLSWRYFLMLTGREDLAKPDRMILGFLERALGRQPSAAEAQTLLSTAVEELQSEYPDLTVQALDHAIWTRERSLGPARRGMRELQRATSKALTDAVDKVVTYRAPAAAEHANRLRTKRPNADASELADAIIRRYRKELGATGAASGASSAVPGIGTAAGTAASGADTTWLMTRLSEMILSIASVYGHTADSVEERRAWVLAVLALATGASTSLSNLPGTLGAKGGVKLVKSIPMPVIHRINKALGGRIIVKWTTRTGAVRLGTLAPFGVGAAVGSGINIALVRAVGNRAKTFFDEP